MNKKILAILLVLFLVLAVIFALTIVSKNTAKPVANKGSNTGMANPASVHCKQQGGIVSIVTDSQGGQTGICVFANGVECEEWKFFRGECSKGAPVVTPTVDINADTELIKTALVEKDGINLSLVDVVVTKDTGKYAGGSIKPKDEGVGGAYFFAAKTDAGWKIVASGNGAITCGSLEPYPDFPVDMIPECVDTTTGNPVQR
jgi:uncharacterized protein